MLAMPAAVSETEFARVGDTVAVRILPHGKLGEVRVVRVERRAILDGKRLKIGQAIAPEDKFGRIIDRPLPLASRTRMPSSGPTQAVATKPLP